jgi:hypothetical protein
VTVTSASGSSTATVIAPNSQAGFVVPILFNQLTGSASLNQVNMLTFEFNLAQTPNIDFELGGIRAVPEPAGILIATLGGAFAFGLPWMRRKLARRRHAA